MPKLSFSGHETFHCKTHWLKKGYDFVKNGGNFSNPDAVVNLGVGKNMVSSIYYWMQSFGLYDGKQLSGFSDYIFGTDGKDPYLEDLATLWLLHYNIIKTNKASLYSIVFNEFRKERIEFTKKDLINFIERKYKELPNSTFNQKTIEKDINVFLQNYVKPNKIKTNLEDNYSYLFADLDLVEEIHRYDDASPGYRIENKVRNLIPWQLIFFAILDNEDYGKSISIDKILFDYNSAGNIFAINSKGLLLKIEEIIDNTKGIVYKDNSGIRELQIKDNINKFEILNIYYAS